LRELVSMKEDGWIDFERNEIYIRELLELGEGLGK
jgi:hypothetical protein